MKNNLSIMPGYRYNEYLLILNPHEELRNKIAQIKKEFHDKYQAASALYGKPHITLTTFTQLEMMEEKIVSRLKTIAMGYVPFKVELKDYGSFPSHTIYINVESKQQVQNLVKELKDAQRLMKLNKDNKPHFIDDPYIPIARKLLPWQYEQGWQEYAHRHFTGRFIADNMLLIKRKAGEKGYQIVQRFEFMNLPVSTKQGELFM
ncbi:MAG: 2'-5' RNA ligase family protein [Chitinophagaceae bacterium]|nr:2'-5' RNA ligase family protein [Chitinophagaceae bacterium]